MRPFLGKWLRPHGRLGVADQIGQANNFTLLRIAAALLVIHGHSYAIVYTPNHDPIADLFRGYIYSGDIAVNFFFVASGFLVMKSALASRTALDFMMARVLRIFPALLVGNLIMISYVATVYNGGAIAAFLTDPQTAAFAFKNSSLSELPIYTLPNAFPESRIQSINGSYWTLPAEVRAYVMLLVISLPAFLMKAETSDLARRFLTVTLAGLLAVALVRFDAIPLVSIYPRYGRLIIYFVIGALYYLQRKHVPLHPALFAAAVAATFASTMSQVLFQYASYVTFPYIVFYIVYGLPYAGALNTFGDFSYGVYVYGFFSQQIVASTNPHQPPWLNTSLAAGLALSFAIPSWFFIEKPALRVRRRVTDGLRRRLRLTARAPASAESGMAERQGVPD